MAARACRSPLLIEPFSLLQLLASTPEGQFMHRDRNRRRLPRTPAALSALSTAAATAVVALSLGHNTARAADGIWTGTDMVNRAWSNTNNWMGGTVPGANDGTFVSPDTALFNIDDGYLNGSFLDTITVDTNRNVANITFDTNAAAYVFTGAALHLTGGGTTQITTNAGNAETLTDLVIEGSSYTLRSDSSTNGQALLTTGAVSFGTGATGPATLTLTGANPAVVSGGTVFQANALGAISNGGASQVNVLVNGSAWAFTAASTYTGTTTVDGSSTFLAIGDNNALGTSTLIIQNSGSVQSYNAPYTIANTVQMPSTGQFNGGSNLTLTGTLTTNAPTLTNGITGGALLTLSGTVFLGNNTGSPRTMILNGGGSTTINGQINDVANGGTQSVRINKSSGSGTLIINSNNAATFTGGVQLSNGTLGIGDNNALGTGPLILAGGTVQGVGAAHTVANTITLSANVNFSGSQDLTFTGSLTNTGTNAITPQSTTNALTFAGPVYLSDQAGTGRTLTVSPGANSTVTIGGVISNFNGSGTAGNLTKSGNGTLILTGANTYSGTTTVSFGTLQIGSGVTGGNTGSILTNITTVAGGIVSLARDGAYTFSNVVSGAGKMITNAPATGQPTITGASTYSGGFTLANNNTVLIGANSTPTTGTVTSGPFGTGTFSLATTPSSNSITQILQPAGADRTIANAMTLGNNLTVQGSFNLTLNGAISMSNGRLLTNNLDAGKTLTLGFNSTATPTITLAGTSLTHQFAGTGNTVVFDSIAGTSSQQLMQDGTGVLTLNAINQSTFSGQTLSLSGAIVYNTSTSLETGPATRIVTAGANGNLFGALGYAGSASGILDSTFLGTINASSTGSFAILAGDAARNLDFTSSPLSTFPNMGIGAAGNITYTGTLTPFSGAYRVGGGTGTLTVASVLSDGAGGYTLNVIGGCVVALTGPNTFTGSTTIAPGGILSVASIPNGGVAGPLGASTNAAANLNINGNLRYTGASATTDRAFTMGAAGSIEVTSAATNLEFDGAVTSGSLTKIGPGTLTLGGANTYTGNTNVNAGTLTVAAAASIGSANVIVASGATLNAYGTLSSTAAVTANGAANFGAPNSTAAATQQLASLAIADGVTASITSSAQAGIPKTLQPASLTFPGMSGSGKIDLTNNILISTGAPTVGEGLITAGNVKTTTAGLVLGYGDAGGGNYKIRATLLGDSDLDGKVNVADLANLAGNFGVTTGMLWINGDFDYNGNVNVADLADLAGNFGNSLAGSSSTSIATTTAAAQPALAIASGSSVPEPAALGLFTTLATLLTRRRSSRRSSRGRS
jgi:fibronectin-binding autotransporter adhesin